MERVLEYQVTEADEGKKISAFLKTKYYSDQILTDLKKDAKGIELNHEYVRQNRLLQAGDFLRVTLRERQESEQILPVDLPFEILYEDQDLLVINKPYGMPIHPSRLHQEDSLANALAYYFKEQGETFVFRCINRLDRDTSGLTIVAKNLLSAGILNREGHMEREYLAITSGCPKEKAGTVDAPIARAKEGQVTRIIDYERGEKAVTHYKVLATKELEAELEAKELEVKELEAKEQEIALVSLLLETGRTHQIRLHMKHLGCPLLGDFLYNPSDTSWMTRQALHAYRVKFTHPITGETMEFRAPLPADMQKANFVV